MGMLYVQARVHQQGLVRLTASLHGEAMVTATGTVTTLLVNTMMATAAHARRVCTPQITAIVAYVRAKLVCVA